MVRASKSPVLKCIISIRCSLISILNVSVKAVGFDYTTGKHLLFATMASNNTNKTYSTWSTAATVSFIWTHVSI